MPGGSGTEIVLPGRVISRDRLSVLHVIAPGDVGGAERVVHTLATGQHRAGHQVRVVAVLANGADRHPFLAPLDYAGLATIAARVHPCCYRRVGPADDALWRRLSSVVAR